MNTDSNTFIKVYGYMMRDLKLNGYELLIYALIKSFTDSSEEKCFYGSQGYLAEWLGTSRQRVGVCLKKLLEKGLVTKKSITIGENELYAYMTQNIAPYATKHCKGVQRNDAGVCNETLHNNNIYNNKDNNINNNINNDIIF